MIYKYISWKIQLTITFTKRAPRHKELTIWGKLVYMVSAKVSYVYIAKSININPAWVNKLPFSCTKRAKRHKELTIWGKLINAVISSIRDVYVTCFKVYCNTGRSNKLSLTGARRTPFCNELTICCIKRLDSCISSICNI